MPRDSQRQKIYDAERIAFAYSTQRPVRGAFALAVDRDEALVEAQALVDRVFSSKFVIEKWQPPKLAPRVVSGHGNRNRGCYKSGRNEIHLPDWTLQRWYVLHEIAHALTAGRDRDAEPPHGRRFAACYLELVRVYMGRHFAIALEDAFKQKRVVFKPKRAYTITDAERERRRARARSLRA